MDEVGEQVSVVDADTRVNGAQPLLGAFMYTSRDTGVRARRGRRRGRFAGWARGRVDQIRSLALTAVALGSPVVAAFEWHPWVGLLALCPAALVMDLAVHEQQGERRVDQRPDVAAR